MEPQASAGPPAELRPDAELERVSRELALIEARLLRAESHTPEAGASMGITLLQMEDAMRVLEGRADGPADRRSAAVAQRLEAAYHRVLMLAGSADEVSSNGDSPPNTPAPPVTPQVRPTVATPPVSAVAPAKSPQPESPGAAGASAVRASGTAQAVPTATVAPATSAPLVTPALPASLVTAPALAAPSTTAPPATITLAPLPIKTPGRLSLTDLVGLVLSGVGLLCLLFIGYEVGVSALAESHTQPALLASFKQDVARTTAGIPSVVPTEGQPVALLTVSRMRLSQVVVEGTSPDDLKSGPGHLRVSPLPGEFGNSVVLGRRTTYGALFRDLDKLRPGDVITVTTGQGTFVYKVKVLRRVDLGTIDPMTATKDSRITLVTSDPPFLSTGRLMAVATLDGKPEAVPTRTTVPIAAADLGATYSPIWLSLAVIWTALLALAAWQTWRLGRRWPFSVTVLLGGPILIGLMLLAFAAFDRFLPGLT